MSTESKLGSLETHLGSEHVENNREGRHEDISIPEEHLDGPIGEEGYNEHHRVMEETCHRDLLNHLPCLGVLMWSLESPL